MQKLQGILTHQNTSSSTHIIKTLRIIKVLSRAGSWLSQRTASHPKKRSHSIICNHTASQDIISPSKGRKQTSFPPLEVIQPLAHALVSRRKCNIMFRAVIVILLAPLTKKHLRHNSDFTFYFPYCLVHLQNSESGYWCPT